MLNLNYSGKFDLQHEPSKDKIVFIVVGKVFFWKLSMTQ